MGARGALAAALLQGCILDAILVYCAWRLRPSRCRAAAEREFTSQQPTRRLSCHWRHCNVAAMMTLAAARTVSRQVGSAGDEAAARYYWRRAPCQLGCSCCRRCCRWWWW